MTVVLALCFLFYAVAAVITGRRATNAHGGDVALPIGLALLAVASLLRLPPVERALVEHAPGGVHELIKHLAFAAGAVSITAWVRTALTGRRTNLAVLAAVGLAVVAAMTVLFLANGPWTSEDLTNQAMGHPSMLLYWLLYNGAGAIAAGAFGISAVRESRTLGRRFGWGMGVAAVGGAAGAAWGVVSFLNHLSDDPHARQSAPGHVASSLTLVATALVCVGATGHLLLAMERRRRRRSDLHALHEHLAGLVAEARLLTPRTALADFHMTIEILDALGVLSRYADPADADRVRELVGDAPREVVLAYRVDLAAARRGMDALPKQSDDWPAWLSDDDALRSLGRAWRDDTSADVRDRLVHEVVEVYR